MIIYQLIPEDTRVPFFFPLLNFNSVTIQAKFYLINFFGSHKNCWAVWSLNFNLDSICFIMKNFRVLPHQLEAFGCTHIPIRKVFVRITLEKQKKKNKQNLYILSFFFFPFAKLIIMLN